MRCRFPAGPLGQRESSVQLRRVSGREGAFRIDPRLGWQPVRTTYAANGSASGGGTVFELDPAGKITVLYGFPGGPPGDTPAAGVIRSSAGNLYGTTNNGGVFTGICSPNGCGVVFKLDTAAHETVLHTYSGGPDGASPHAGLIADSEGNLYGTTFGGGLTGIPSCLGNIGCGVVFKLKP